MLVIDRPRTDNGGMRDKVLGRLLAAVALASELPLIGQLFLFGDVFDWGWLFFLAIAVAPAAALAGLAISIGQRDRVGIVLATLALGGIMVPILVVWAIVETLQAG
jgi:hypothetical protein